MRLALSILIWVSSAVPARSAAEVDPLGIQGAYVHASRLEASGDFPAQESAGHAVVAFLGRNVSGVPQYGVRIHQFGSNGHFCSVTLVGEQELENNRRIYMDTPQVSCRLQFDISDKGLLLSGERCESYCGAKAALSGLFVKTPAAER